jgi:Spy/CpxP family protein refolding chaperone
MLGLIIGTVCLIGLIRMFRRGRHCGGFGYEGYACGHGPRTGGWRAFRGPRWWLRSIFERLETTPGQEKAVVGALEDLLGSRTILREEMKQTRADLARAISSGLVDDATLEETFARHDRLLAPLRVSFVETLKKVVEALDERQRKQLADAIEGGGMFGGGQHWGGPYRGVWA